MNDEKLRRQLGRNIVLRRKKIGLTQVALAEKLNYSDKAVSKWERGESTPDVLTLVQLADFFGVTVNDLLQDPDALPENTSKVEKVMSKAVEKTFKRKANKRIILQLSSLLVWSVALVLFVLFSSLGIEKSYVAFFYALPVDAIVMLSLRSAWRDYRSNKLLVSVLVWGSIISLYVTFLLFFGLNLWRILLLGIPGQLAVLFWFRLYHAPVQEEENG